VGATGQPEILITWPDGRKEKRDAPATLAHNYALNMDFQGQDIWVATAAGLSHGMVESSKEITARTHSLSLHRKVARLDSRPAQSAGNDTISESQKEKSSYESTHDRP